MRLSRILSGLINFSAKRKLKNKLKCGLMRKKMEKLKLCKIINRERVDNGYLCIVKFYNKVGWQTQ